MAVCAIVALVAPDGIGGECLQGVIQIVGTDPDDVDRVRTRVAAKIGEEQTDLGAEVVGGNAGAFARARARPTA